MSTAPTPPRTSIITVAFAAAVFQLAAMSAAADSGSSGIASISTAPLAAELTPDVPRVVVSYGDLDLSSPAGFKILESRVKRAVRTVCGNADIRDLSRTQAVAECRGMALHAALDHLRHADEDMYAYWLQWRAAYIWTGDEAIAYN